MRKKSWTVTKLLETKFPKYVDYEFTADMVMPPAKCGCVGGILRFPPARATPIPLSPPRLQHVRLNIIITCERTRSGKRCGIGIMDEYKNRDAEGTIQDDYRVDFVRQHLECCRAP